MTYYVVVATFMIALIGFVWSGKGWPNIAIKLAFVGIAVWGAICSAAALGIRP